jgi:hypothetical protein
MDIYDGEADEPSKGGSPDVPSAANVREESDEVGRACVTLWTDRLLEMLQHFRYCRPLV